MRKDVTNLKTKQLYNSFVVTETQRPASLPYWYRVLPNLDEGQIWDQWKIRGNSLEAEDNDFKIRHNKVFTNVILHQFDRGVRRECDVCESKAETLIHMFCECECLSEFFGKLKSCLRDKLGLLWDRRDSWMGFFLFGTWKESRVKNAVLCRFLLSHARWAIRSRRNIAHYERRKASVWILFKSIVRKQISYRHKHGTEDFTLLFTRDSELLSLDDDGRIVWNW